MQTVSGKQVTRNTWWTENIFYWNHEKNLLGNKLPVTAYTYVLVFQCPLREYFEIEELMVSSLKQLAQRALAGCLILRPAE